MSDVTKEQAKQWIRGVRNLFTAPRWYSAYNIKHRIEETFEEYCSTETAYDAAEDCGLRVKEDADGFKYIRLYAHDGY